MSLGTSLVTLLKTRNIKDNGIHYSLGIPCQWMLRIKMASYLLELVGSTAESGTDKTKACSGSLLLLWSFHTHDAAWSEVLHGRKRWYVDDTAHARNSGTIPGSYILTKPALCSNPTAHSCSGWRQYIQNYKRNSCHTSAPWLLVKFCTFLLTGGMPLWTPARTMCSCQLSHERACSEWDCDMHSQSCSDAVETNNNTTLTQYINAGYSYCTSQ